MFFYGSAGDSPDMIRVKGICWDCKWFPIIFTATGRTLAHTHTSLKTGTMNRNLDVLDRVAPKADRLQGWQVRFTLTLVADSDVLVSDGAAELKKIPSGFCSLFDKTVSFSPLLTIAKTKFRHDADILWLCYDDDSSQIKNKSYLRYQPGKGGEKSLHRCVLAVCWSWPISIIYWYCDTIKLF